MSRQPLFEAWKEFRSTVVREEVPPMVAEDMRRSFLAGAYALGALLMKPILKEAFQHATGKDRELVVAIGDEFADFEKEIHRLADEEARRRANPKVN